MGSGSSALKSRSRYVARKSDRMSCRQGSDVSHNLAREGGESMMDNSISIARYDHWGHAAGTQYQASCNATPAARGLAPSDSVRSWEPSFFSKATSCVKPSADGQRERCQSRSGSSLPILFQWVCSRPRCRNFETSHKDGMWLDRSTVFPLTNEIALMGPVHRSFGEAGA
jgi:hypothetical protein